MAVVVSDASVLISLAAVGQIHLLREFFEKILVPDAVWREVTAAGASLPGAKETAQAHNEGWLQVRTPTRLDLAATLAGWLGAGEAGAIALASELTGGLLLIDEQEGRAAARTLGVVVTGTLGILVRAKREGKIALLKPILDKLRQQYDFRLSHGLYEQVLREIGELT